MEKKYVPSGVYLVCDKGTIPSEFTNFNYGVTLFDNGISTHEDKILMLNFKPFGACALCNGAPCTAPVTNWNTFADGISFDGKKLLLENSELTCATGGNIKIFFSLAAAQAALPPKKKSFWDYVFGVSETISDFKIGIAKGLWNGLKGTVVGVFNLVGWARKHHPISYLIDPEGYEKLIENDIKTAKAIGNLAVKVGRWGYRNSRINLNTNPKDFILAQQENKVMMDGLIDKASKMNAEEWGDFTGQVIFEVALEVGTAGAVSALTVVKTADRVVDISKAVNKLDNLTDAKRTLDKLEDVADVTKVVDKVEDASDVGKLEDLGDVTNKATDLIADINSSRKAYEKSIKNHSVLPKSKKVKTVASDGVNNTVSGSSQKRISNKSRNAMGGVEDVPPKDVFKHSDEIKHKLNTNSSIDNGIPGQASASHAEKQLLTKKPGEPIGVSKKMCNNCKDFTQKQADAINKDIVITDPDGTKIFKPGESNPVDLGWE